MTPRPGLAERVPLTFFLAGFSKCGTTSLTQALNRHPAIVMPAEEEPWFFIDEDYAQQWAALRALYPPDLSAFAAVGEDSTAYSAYRWGDVTSARILGEYPEARFLFVVRDPAARIESGFREFHDSGPRFGLNAPFELSQALVELPELLQDSLYWERLSVYRRQVSPDRIKIVFFEDLLDRPDDELAQIHEFLGVDPVATGLPQLNPGDMKRRDTRLLRRMRAPGPLGRALARIPAQNQDRVLSPVGLRRTFREAVTWDPDAIRIVREQLLPDVQKFREQYGRPRRGWQRLTEVARQQGPRTE